MKKNANIYKIFFISIFILFFNKEIAKAENKNDFRTLKSYCELSHGGEVRAARQCSADRASGCTTTPS